MTKKTITQEDLMPRGGAIHVQPVDKVYTLVQARQKQTRLYWNGTPCKNGHVSVRYTKDGVCKQCYGNKTKRGSTQVVDREKVVVKAIPTHQRSVMLMNADYTDIPTKK